MYGTRALRAGKERRIRGLDETGGKGHISADQVGKAMVIRFFPVHLGHDSKQNFRAGRNLNAQQ
jgi:hypothetical protein